MLFIEFFSLLNFHGKDLFKANIVSGYDNFWNIESVEIYLHIEQLQAVIQNLNILYK